MLDMVNRASSSEDKTNSRKSWTWIIVDALIIGAIAMAASMPSTVPTWIDAWTMFKGFFVAFVLQLAVERGLKRAPPQE